MGRISQVLYSVFRTARRGLVPAPTASDVSSQRLLRADGAWADQPTGGLPSQTGNASKLLSTDGTNAAWRTISETPIEGRILAGDVTRTVAPYVLSDGATANRAGVATLTAATDPKTRTIQLYGLVPVPTSNPSGSSIFCAAWCSTITPYTAQPNSLFVYLGTNGALVVRAVGAAAGADTRDFSSTTFRTTYSGRTVALSITIFGDSTTNPVVYADGVDISSSFTLTTAGTVPNWLPSTLAATYYLTGYNWPGIRGPVMEYGFGAWSAAEVATWAQTGVTPSWWAAATGSAAAGYTSDFSAGTNSWLQAVGDANLVLSGNVDGVAGVDDTLEVLASGAAKSLAIRRASTRVAGARYYTTFDYFAESGCGVPFLGIGTVNAREDAAGVAVVEGTWRTGNTLEGVALSTDGRIAGFTTSGGSSLAQLASGKKVHFKNIVNRTLGPAARWALQPACSVAPDSTTNGIPLQLTPGMTVAGDLLDHVVVQANPMTADGFVLADQVLTDSRYELVGCNVRQTGTATSTITVRETSSGGTTVATGALSSSATRVGLTVSNGLLAGGKKLHLTNSSWSGNTVTPFFIFRRSQMP